MERWSREDRPPRTGASYREISCCQRCVKSCGGVFLPGNLGWGGIAAITWNDDSCRVWPNKGGGWRQRWRRLGWRNWRVSRTSYPPKSNKTSCLCLKSVQCNMRNPANYVFIFRLRSSWILEMFVTDYSSTLATTCSRTTWQFIRLWGNIACKPKKRESQLTMRRTPSGGLASGLKHTQYGILLSCSPGSWLPVSHCCYLVL